MPTVSVNLDTTQYVQVNTGLNPLLLQAHRDAVRVTLSDAKPAKSNTVFHLCGRDDPILQFNSIDTNVWALATTDNSSLVVSETGPVKVIQGEGDLTIDAWGVAKASLPKSLFHGLWTFNVPESMWFMYENSVQVYASVDITSTNSAAKLLTTVTNTELILESRECPRYQPNRGHLFSTALWCPNKTNDGVRHWGLSTDENGIEFTLKADGLLYATMHSAGVQVRESVIDTSDVASFDVEKGNIYDIQYQWRGVGNYKFFINNVLVHTFSLLGTLTELSMENPALPIHFHCERTTQDVEMNIGCADITSENGDVDKEQYASAYTQNYSGAVADFPVLIISNPLQVSGKTNTRTSTLARVTVNCSKKAGFTVWATRTPADIIGAVFKPINSGSFLESDSTDMDPTATRATAVTVANLRFITFIPVEANVRAQTDNPYRGRIEFPIVRGDYLIVTCDDSSATADCVIEFGDQV